MKRVFFLSIIISLFSLAACKKDSVDATDTKTLQSSINDMASELSTFQQVKFNEALYILKTFAVQADNDIQQLAALGKLINGMKVPEILALADKTAQENGIDWASTAPPSLGEMNIFASEKPTEYDPNDIKAKSLNLAVIEIMKDAERGTEALQIVPTLIDQTGKAVEFSGTALETILEVYSAGNRIFTAKNLMVDSEFKGFTLKFASLSADKVINNEIDIAVSVKTTKQTFKMSKIGVLVNPQMLKSTIVYDSETDFSADSLAVKNSENEEGKPHKTADPKATVSRFLSNLNAQNFRGAFGVSENPNWGSYENFSNPNSGFGAVKSISVKNIATNSANENSASIDATYDVTDKDGVTTPLRVTFGLKNINGEWKISSYRIN